MTKILMRSVCVAAVAAAGMCGASAQQMIEPASATPVPGPMPEILRQYAPVTAALGLQPARGDHARQRGPAATGLELRYRPDRGP
jgi:hypothetical protein